VGSSMGLAKEARTNGKPRMITFMMARWVLRWELFGLDLHRG
jgi:hypothetical protein